MRRVLLSLICCLSLNAGPIQDPVNPKKDNIYVEFLTDCNWLVWELEGKIKLKADIGNFVGFRAFEPNRPLGSIEMRGNIVFRDLPYLWARDYVIQSNSAFIAEPPEFLPFSTWNYVIHYNEFGGTGWSNAGAIMRVWGPCKWVRLYHGEAMVKHGDTIEYIKVDENNYLLYPIWEIELN